VKDVAIARITLNSGSRLYFKTPELLRRVGESGGGGDEDAAREEPRV